MATRSPRKRRSSSSREVPASDGHNVMWDFAPVRDQALTFLETDGRVLLAS